MALVNSEISDSFYRNFASKTTNSDVDGLERCP